MAGLIRIASRSSGDAILKHGGRIAPTGRRFYGPASVEEVDYSGKKLALLLEGPNGSTTFTDGGANAYEITSNNGASITTSTFVQGSASGSFVRASGQFLSFSGASALTLSGNFRVTFSARFTSLPTPGQVWTVITGTGFGFGYVRFQNTGSGIVLQISAPYSSQNNASSPLSLSLNQWYDFEVERVGSTITFRQDAVSVGTSTSTATFDLAVGGTNIGGLGASNNFDGQLDALVIG